MSESCMSHTLLMTMVSQVLCTLTKGTPLSLPFSSPVFSFQIHSFRSCSQKKMFLPTSFQTLKNSYFWIHRLFTKQEGFRSCFLHCNSKTPVFGFCLVFLQHKFGLLLSFITSTFTSSVVSNSIYLNEKGSELDRKPFMF